MITDTLDQKTSEIIDASVVQKIVLASLFSDDWDKYIKYLKKLLRKEIYKKVANTY